MVGPYRKSTIAPLRRADRSECTILFSGLTDRHDRLIAAALRPLGYRLDALGAPDREALGLGKTLGNPGVCHPAHFMAGRVLARLRQLEGSGLSRQEIAARYAMGTVTSCGPCRLGLYRNEIEEVFRHAGFGDLRVVLLEQRPSRAGVDAGVEVDLPFINGFATAVMLADLINELRRGLRPYEREGGAVEHALDGIEERLTGLLAAGGEAGKDGGRVRTMLRVRRQVREALVRACQVLHPIRLDRLRVKPVIKVTGEFWAHTTEGYGNYHLYDFIESQGGETLAEPVTNWVRLLLDHSRREATDRWRNARVHGWRERLRVMPAVAGEYAQARIGERLLVGQFERLRRAAGGLAPPLYDQRRMRRLAEKFYNPRATAGEGHMEVAHSLYYLLEGHAHAVVSVKPFGCMPSTQSDGVQAAIVARHPDALFLSIETGDDGEINALSRVQMIIWEAARRAQEEFDRELAQTGYTLEQVRAYIESHPEMECADYRVPTAPGVIGAAARFVRHAGQRMVRDGWTG